MFWNQYPYINLNDLNLDFLLKAIGEMQNEVENFVTLNAVKYADPIQWNITKQYQKNTIVIDPLTGTAYISTKPVPSGVALNDTNFWTVVFDLSMFITQANVNLTEHVEGAGVVYSTFPLNENDWVIWNGVLYKALVNMPIGTAYSVNSNIERVTVEDYIKNILTAIANEVQARIDADTTLQTNIDNEAITRGNADTALSNAIGDLSTLLTTNKTSTVDAINEVFGMASNAGIYNNTTPDSGLTTNIGLEEGVYNITSDLTVNAQLVVPKGAIINVASGVTLTINGQILAGRYQIFSGDGIVTSNCIAYPEWFGSISNDWTIAIQKCLDYFNGASLDKVAYNISDTLRIRKGNIELCGFSGDYWGGNVTTWPTRIISSATNKNIIYSAPDVGFLDVGDEINNISIHDILFGLSSAPTAPTDSSTGNGMAGISLYKTKFSYITRCRVVDCIMGYRFSTCQRLKFEDCSAFRTSAAVGDTVYDKFYGFYLDGGSNNATAYIINCTAYMNDFGSTNTVGFQGVGYTNDLVIDKFEVFGMHTGINLYGSNVTKGANVDIHIINCILDQIRSVGITCDNFTYAANIEIGGNYIAMNNNSLSGFGLDFTNCKGSMTIHDNQFIGVTNTATYGMRINGCRGAMCRGNLWSLVTTPLDIENCVSCVFEDVLHHDDEVTSNIGVYVVSCTECYFAFAIIGHIANSFTTAILTSSADKCEFNLTAINANSVGTKLNLNGTPVTTAGVIGTNLVSGIV